MNNLRTLIRTAWRSAVLALVVVGAAGQELQGQETIPPSTNPTNRVIYPGADQDAQQQMTDQLECYRWATQQTSWDPYVAYDQLVQQGHAAQQSAEQAQGGLVKGAAGGALAGVAIGAIAGDAGKGAAIGAVAGGLVGGSRSRRAKKQAEDQAQAAQDAYNQQLQGWDRNYAACMQGRNYVVN